MQKQKFINILQANNLKITKKREAVIDVLIANQERLLNVDEILSLSKAKEAKINLTTVYRNLELFNELGLLHQLILKDQMNYYKISCFEEHHHHLICENCGRITAIEHCPLEALQVEADKHHFKINGHKLEVYGLCQECQKEIVSS